MSGDGEWVVTLPSEPPLQPPLLPLLSQFVVMMQLPYCPVAPASVHAVTERERTRVEW